MYWRPWLAVGPRPRKLQFMARKENADTTANPGRLKQIALTYKMTRKADSKVGLVVAAVGIVTFGVFLALGFWIGHPIYLGILGFLLAFLAMAIVFGRRAERAAFGQMEGQPGPRPRCSRTSAAAGRRPRRWR